MATKELQKADPDTCGACRYFVRHDTRESSGDCFANPPMVLDSDEGTCSSRPTVDDTDMRCRHFQPRLSA